MKIQLLSDIHLEYYDKYPGLNYFIEPTSPILVLVVIFVIININISFLF